VIDGKILASVRKKLRRAAREDTVEGYLVERVAALGGVAAKLMLLTGWPDRLVLLPGGIIAFVECKRPHGGRDEPMQPRVQKMLGDLGFNVHKIKSKPEVDALLEIMQDA
jgi:hypothetical protein